GESGSGKSVTVQSIMRLISMPPGEFKSGSIIMNDEDIVEKSEKEMEAIRGQEIGMIFQDPMTSLNPTMKIGRQITEGLIKHQNMSKREAKERGLELLRLVGIPNPERRINQYPHEYSGGMRQRAVIAIALSCIVTSSAVVCSSAMMILGLQDKAIAITALCLIPPEYSCGYWFILRSGLGMPTNLSNSSPRSLASRLDIF